MALFDCPECGKEISDKAPSCPNCGIVFEPCENPIPSKSLEEPKFEKNSVVWGFLKWPLCGVIALVLWIPSTFVGTCLLGVIFMIILPSSTGEWAEETLKGILMGWMLYTGYYSITYAWKIIHRSTGLKILAKWENKGDVEEVPDGLDLLLSASQLEEEGKSEEAIAIYQQIDSMHLYDKWEMYSVAGRLERQGLTEKAIAMYQCISYLYAHDDVGKDARIAADQLLNRRKE